MNRIILLKVPYYQCLEPFAVWLEGDKGFPIFKIEPGIYIRQAGDIILGLHALAIDHDEQLKDCIVYDTEQFSWRDFAPRQKILYFSTYRSLVNCLPLGYLPKLYERNNRLVTTQDIDILFYGSLNGRRRKILKELETRLNVVSVFNVFGEELDALIDRSKAVLNIHFYEEQLFECARVIPAMHRGALVLSEPSPVDTSWNDLCLDKGDIVRQIFNLWEMDRLEVLRIKNMEVMIKNHPYITSHLDKFW